MAFGRNTFDDNDNLWQCLYFNDGQLGAQISILNIDINTNNIQYIGHIRIKNPVYGPNNIVMGGDGFMYITTGSFLNDDTKSGSLMRIKLKDNNKREL